MSQDGTIFNTKHRMTLHGSVLSARTGKVALQGTVGAQFNIFYVPHSYSFLPVKASPTSAAIAPNSIAAAQKNFLNNLSSRYDGQIVPSSEFANGPRLRYEVEDMRDVSIETLAHGYSHTVDAEPVGRPQKISALEGIKGEHCGFLHQNVKIAARSGAVFKIYGKRLMSSALGEPTQTACGLIRVRHTAAYKRISMTLPPSPRLAYPECMIEGRFDIIGLPDLYRMGAAPMRQGFESLYDPVEFEELFTIEDVLPEIEALPKVVAVETLDESGESVKVSRARTRRKVGDSE